MPLRYFRSFSTPLLTCTPEAELPVLTVPVQHGCVVAPTVWKMHPVLQETCYLPVRNRIRIL